MPTTSLPQTLRESHEVIVLYSEQVNLYTKRLEVKDEEITAKDEEITAKEKQITAKDEEITARDKQITKLAEENRLLRKLRFAHKSEKWTNKDKQQALLFDEAESVSQPQKVEDASTETITYTRKKKAGRKKLDPNLPRKEIIHDLSESEKVCKCGHHLKEIDRDYREELDMEPAKYWVNRHIYPQYGCTHCTMTTDETQPEIKSARRHSLIPKSFASPGLLSHLVVSKFKDHLPFYRMERILSRLGVTLPRATMCNWMIQLKDKIEPILDVMSKDILQSQLIMADETTLQVMKEPGRKNTTKSYMWIFRGQVQERPVLLYQYHPTRSGKVASDFLKDYEGYLLTDGYSGYNEVSMRPEITHPGCWAHARRKLPVLTAFSR